MKNTPTLAFILFVVAIPLFSQTDYKPGFIINNNNDTLYGAIEVRVSTKGARECKFKDSAMSNKVIKYTPNEIRGYRILDYKNYISKKVTINGEEQELFLEFLLDGIADLYYLQYENKSYYFMEKAGELVQLTNEKIEVNRNGTKYVTASKKYLGKLNCIFSDAPELKNEINNTGFGHSSLIKIAEKYHHEVCPDYECVKYLRVRKLRLWVEPQVGVSQVNLRFNDGDVTNTDNSAEIGLFLKLNFPKMNYSWSARVGAVYSSNKFEGKYNTTSSEANYVKYSYSKMNLPLSVEYAIPTRKIVPFVEVGCNVAFLIAPEAELNWNYSIGKVEYTQTYSKDDYMLEKPLQLGGKCWGWFKV